MQQQPHYNTQHNFQIGQRVTVNGIPGTVRGVYPSGALSIAMDKSTTNTYLEGVKPVETPALTTEQENVILNELCTNAHYQMVYAGVE